MRVLKLEAINLNQTKFSGKNKQRGRYKKTEGEKEAEETAEFYYNCGFTPIGNYYPFTSNQSLGAGKNKHSNGKYYLDINKILSINAPEQASKKPASFEETHAKFTLDKYQKEAIETYNGGKTTIVSAPTGTGKTLIAEYAIKDTLEKDKKLIYLSPLKALSNEKYAEFSKLFGTYDKEGNLINTKNVGLLTGDTSINPNAPILVMTTEIYRNSLLSNDKRTANVNYENYDGVIYDEFHYMGDKERGTVWEEAVMNTPKHMKQMMLSATASNAKDIEGWIKNLNGEIETHLVSVPESERHVPLREYVMTEDNNGNLRLESAKKHKIDLYRLKNKINVSDRQMSAASEACEILNLKDYEELMQYLGKLKNKKNYIDSEYFAEQLEKAGAGQEKAEALGLILSSKAGTTVKKEPEGNYIDNLQYGKIVEFLNDKEMTPALFYIFSKKGCNKEMERAAKHSKSLLTPEESKRVYDEVQKAKEKGVYLGSDFDDKQLEYLMKGFAVHHAGKLPAYKSLVENLARQGLIKACFATDTLIAGINMPFRTTVFGSMEKFNGEEIAEITNTAFKQGSGRAGRRGKDEIGNVVIIPYNYDEYRIYARKTQSKDTSIKSRYNVSYASLLSENMFNNFEETLLKTFSAYQNSVNLDRNEDLINGRLEVLKHFGFIKQKENGLFERTEKGNLAKSVFGINEIVMTELLLDPKYLKDMTSKELIAVCSMFSDVKDENPSRELKNGVSYLNNRLGLILDLVDEVDLFEEYENIKHEKTPVSTNLTPYVIKFSELPDTREEAIEGWGKIMNTLRDRELLFHNGDFLRVINGTIDILKLVQELSPDEKIREEASIAIESLKKPPVVDIFNYELQENIK